MTSQRAKEVERAVADLSGDPLLAGRDGASAPVLVWDARVRRVLYASGAAASLRALVADPSGRVRLGRPARDRLRALAGGLTGRERFRLELMRLGRDPSSPATMLACRRLDLAGGPVLLTVIVGGPPNLRRSAPDLVASPQLAERLKLAGAPRPLAVIDEPRAVPLVQGAKPEPETEVEDLTPETPRPGDGPAPSGDATLPRPSGSGPRRFLWSTDAAGRITSVSPGLAAAVGAEHADILGRSWPELADRTLLDPMGTVARHLASGRAWRDVEVAWRAAEPGCVVPITLGATPVRTPEGAVEGYRGSGLVRLAETARLGVERRVPRGVPGPTMATPAPAEPVTALSFSERGALHEIARALGGRFDRADAEPATGRTSAEIIPLVTARPREPDPLGLLDRLPVGIAVFRGETPIHLNATLLAWLGHADLAEVVAHGAVQVLSRAQDGPAATVLATRTGASLGVEAEGAAIAWGELPARLVTVTRRPDGDPAARLAAAELDLAAAHARHATLAATLDLAEVGAATLDETGRILSLNGPARRLLGYEEREVAGEPFATLLAPAGRPAFAGWLERLDTDHRLMVRLRDGAEVPLLVRGARIAARDAAVILAWREARQEARHEAPADTVAEPLPPLPARVLARVSHEILTPANAIVDVAGQMLEARPGPTGQRDRTQLRDIARSGEQVAALASDLLDLSQMASGSGRLEPTSLDLNGLVAESVARLQPAASRERVVMRTSLRPDLSRVVADERSLRQIAFSVLSNAIRDTGAGGQVIVSTARTERGETALRVRDTGGRAPSAGSTPTPPADAARDPVRDPLAELSLPLSQALAEANRATFRVASDGASGTLVEVVFPAARDAAE